jgi:hypothetical protein
MTIPHPSKLSATISGLALGFAAPALDFIQQVSSLSPHIRDALFIGVVSIFLFIPAVLFVFGIECLSHNAKNKFKFDKEIIVRMFCWLAGGGVAFAFFSALQGLFNMTK